MEINPQPIRGNWRAGWALDLHTVSSRAVGGGDFDTDRTEIGQALFLLKYRYDRSKIEPLARSAASFIEARPELRDVEVIIPVPPSEENRPFQPVEELAVAIARKASLWAALSYLIKVKRTKSLKDIHDWRTRKQELEGAFRVRSARFAEKDVLLFDDLFRSGETLREATHVLVTQGDIANVFVLTLTKTRTKR